MTRRPRSIGRTTSGRHHLGERLVVPGDPCPAVAGEDKGALDEVRVLCQYPDPGVGVAGHVLQPHLDALGGYQINRTGYYRDLSAHSEAQAALVVHTTATR